MVAMKRDMATLRLELQETRDRLAKERLRLSNLEKNQASQVEELVGLQLEKLFTRLSASLSQLRMQSALLEKGIPVSAKDVMILAQHFADTVQEAGLEPIGTPGDVILFDPEIAQPLTTGAVFNTGEQVVVRFIGYRYRGRVIRKALVELSSDRQGGSKDGG